MVPALFMLIGALLGALLWRVSPNRWRKRDKL